MRHRVIKHSFSRKPSARKALMRGLVDSLVEHGRIKTTLPKAKELRRQVEKAVTMGKKGTVHARRILLSRYPNDNTVAGIVNNIAPRFKDRPGGYTRIIKLGNRAGDNAEMAFIEFVDYELPEASSEETVQGDKEAAQRLRTQAREAQKRRKTLRKIQEESRRINRA